MRSNKIISNTVLLIHCKIGPSLVLFLLLLYPLDVFRSNYCFYIECKCSDEVYRGLSDPFVKRLLF